LQNVELPNDDGASLNHEATLILAAEAQGSPSGNDCGRDIRRAHGRIMTEARIGRLLPACLHQAIADELPMRLEFYETWLRSDGLRDGTIGLAPVTAVMSFLRTEGDAYQRVVERAGTLAADWTMSSLTPLRRRTIAWLPRPLKTRAAIRLAASIVETVGSASRASTRVRRGRARLDVQSSIFCSVRDRYPMPLCGFYLASTIAVLRHCGLVAAGHVETCRGAGGEQCQMTIDLGRVAAADAPAIAA
jgi:hypothetical protein